MREPNIDLEKPYQDAARRQERFQQKCDEAERAVWFELTDELEVEKFIYDHLADPDKLLRDIIHAVAVAKEKNNNLHLGADRTLDDAVTRRNKINGELLEKIRDMIAQHVEEAAEHRADNA